MSFLQDEASFVFLHEQLVEVLQTLTPREQQVLSCVLGCMTVRQERWRKWEKSFM